MLERYLEKIKRKENLFLIGLLVIEYLLFRSYALREVVNVIPRHNDQIKYLHQAYDIYDLIVQGNIANIWNYVYAVTTNSALNNINPFALFLFGYSRLSLLTVNFIFFFSVQVVGYKVFKKISNDIRAGMFFIGLFLMINTTFAHVGDILDYRWDFPAFCAYTIWALTLLLWVHCKEEKYFVYSAIASGVLAFVRFYYSAFIAIFIVFYFGIRFIKKQYTLKEAIMKVTKYGMICMCAGGWSVIVYIKNVFSYITRASNSALTVLWHPEMSFKEAWNYYFKSLFSMHIHILFLVVFCCVIFAIIFYCINKKKTKNYIVGTIGCMLLVFIMPVILFLFGSTKNSSVLSLNVGLVPIVIVYGIIIFSKEMKMKKWKMENIFSVVAISIFCLGIFHYAHGTMSVHKGQDINNDRAATEINRAIVDFMENNDIEHATYMTDRHSDIINSDTMIIYSYEHYRQSIDIEESFIFYDEKGEAHNTEYGQFLMSDITEEHLLSLLQQSTFVLVARSDYNKETAYTVDASMKQYRDMIYSYASSHMIPILTKDYYGTPVTVFARNQVKMLGGYSDDWISTDNVKIQFKKQDMKDSYIVLNGNCGYLQLESLNLYIDESDIPIPVEFDRENDTWTVKIDIREWELGEHIVSLHFDNYAIPSQINADSTDERKLVAMMPHNVEIIREIDQ